MDEIENKIEDRNSLAFRYPLALQFSKFVLVGAVNTIIDFSILNFLILVSGHASGFYYPVFKSFSFLFAVTNSYFMNKRWTFKSTQVDSANEFLKFISVNLVGLGINVGSATYIVNVVGVPQGFSPVLWANLGAASAVVITLLWNFTAMKLFIFKK